MTWQDRLNVGSIDRTLRAAVGFALLSLTLAGPKTVWGLFGLIPLATALVGWCPLYALLGINTRVRQQHTAPR